MFKNNLIFLFFSFIIFISIPNYAEQLKVLHLSFHKGCIKDFEYVARQLNLNLTSVFVQDQPARWLDGQATGNAIYNIGHARAEKIWNLHQDYFNQFDVIITSDTAPLARIFLQSNWKKPLIIWICNRFDYYDGASLDCHFPDPEYYQLFREARHKNNIKIIAYTPFEHYYTKLKGVDTGTLTIKPCSKPANFFMQSDIPANIIKSETFFIPPYLNDTVFCKSAVMCNKLGIPVYNGRYNGPGDLKDFKGIIHIPYAWSNLALFENLQNGVPYFVPSKKFILELQKQGDFFFTMLSSDTIGLSEWYSHELKDVLIYFDSWNDLAKKIKQTDFIKTKQKIQKFACWHHDTMMARWKTVFEEFKGY